MTTSVSSASRTTNYLTVFKFILLGSVVCIFSLNGVLLKAAQSSEGRIAAILTTLGTLPRSIYSNIGVSHYFLFEILLRWVLLLLVLYLFLLVLSSLRHRSAVLFISGVGGLLAGLYTLTWFSLVIALVKFIFWLIAVVASAILFVISAIISFFLWPPVVFTLLFILAAGITIAVVALVRKISFRELLNAILDYFRNISAQTVFTLALILVGIALVYWVGLPLFKYYIAPILIAIRDWLIEYVGPILNWIIFVVGVVLAILILTAIVIGTLIVLGWQFTEQFTSARWCGRNTHILFEASFAVGFTLSLVLLVCAANNDFRSLVNSTMLDTAPTALNVDLFNTVYYLMPASIESALHGVLAKASLPLFDLATLMFVLTLANCSLITCMISGITVEPLKGLFKFQSLPPVGKVMIGVVIGLFVLVVGSVVSEDS